MKLEELDSVNKLFEEVKLWNDRESFMLAAMGFECPIIIDKHNYNYESDEFAKIVCDLPKILKLKIINMVLKSVVSKRESLEKEFENL